MHVPCSCAFFLGQVVKKNPAGLRRVKAGDAYAKQMGHLDVAVAVRVSQPGGTLQSALVDLLPERGPDGRLGLRFFDAPKVTSIAEATQCVSLWTQGSTGAQFSPKFLPGFPEYVRGPAGELVSHMARMGAISGSMNEHAMHISHDEEGAASNLESLECLQNAGLATATFCDSNQSAWLLSAEALQHCHLSMRLSSPVSVFAVPDGQPALSWTRMELLSYLDRQHWRCNFLSDDPDARGAVVPLDLTFRTSDDKNVYVLKGKLLHRYLCCLAYADAELPLPGQPEEIRHFENDTYYGKILGLDACAGTKPLPLTDGAAVPRAAFAEPQHCVNDFDELPELDAGRQDSVQEEAEAEAIEEALDLLEDESFLQRGTRPLFPSMSFYPSVAFFAALTCVLKLLVVSWT